MGLYSRILLPRLTHLACGLRPAMRQRGKVVPRASGRVLEIGFGSGLNLPFYDPARVRRLWALEPAPQMTRLARKALRATPLEVELLHAPAEEIPLEGRSVDSVVVTYTLCTIPDVTAALHEVRRVLAPSGRLFFCEHGAAPDESVRRWQDRLDPLWRPLAGGCRLNREIPGLIAAGGLRVEDLETLYLPGWRPATFNYWGSAVPS